MTQPTLWPLLRKLAARTDGFSTAEVVAIAKCDRPKVGKACQSLVIRGEVVVLKVSHKYCRYFATLAQLSDYQVRLDNNMLRGLRVKKTSAKRVAPWPEGTPVIVPKHVKVQVCPSHAAPRNEMFEFPFFHTRKGL